MAHSLELLAEKYSQVIESLKESHEPITEHSSPFSLNRKRGEYKGGVSFHILKPGDEPVLSYNTWHPRSGTIVPRGTLYSDWKKLDTERPAEHCYGNVDNTTYPLAPEEIAAIADKYPNVDFKWVGDARDGLYGKAYSFKIKGPHKELESLTDELISKGKSEDPGIEFSGSLDPLFDESKYEAPGKLKKGHNETDMSNPEERTEVHIANEILKATDMKQVKSLAEELLKMHGQKASDDGPLYPPYGGHNKE